MSYISLDERGIAYLTGSRIKVLNIAEEYHAGRSPEEIRRDREHLSRAQIHAALAYYFDH